MWLYTSSAKLLHSSINSSTSFLNLELAIDFGIINFLTFKCDKDLNPTGFISINLCLSNWCKQVKEHEWCDLNLACSNIDVCPFPATLNTNFCLSSSVLYSFIASSGSLADDISVPKLKSYNACSLTSTLSTYDVLTSFLKYWSTGFLAPLPTFLTILIIYLLIFSSILSQASNNNFHVSLLNVSDR